MKEILRLFSRFLISFSIFGLLMDYGQVMNGVSDQGYERGIILLVLVLSCYIVTRKVKYFSLFLFLHMGLVFAAGLGASTEYMKAVLLVIGSVLALLSVRDRLNRGKDNYFGYGWGMVFGFVFLAGYFMKCRESTYITSHCFLLYTVVYFIMLLLRKQEQYLKNYSNRENIPKNQICFASNFMAGIFVCILIPGLFLVNKLRLNKIIEALKKALLTFFRWLFGFLPESSPIAEEGEKAEPPGIADLGPLKEAPLWLKQLSEIICWIILIGVFCFILYRLFVWIYGIYKRFMEAKQLPFDIAEDVIPDKIEKKIRPNKKKVHFSFLEGPEDKIRRIYKKTVLAAAKKEGMERSRLKYKTPWELAGSLTLCKSADNQKVLTKLYQKARFSQTEITKEEAAEAKKACL